MKMELTGADEFANKLKALPVAMAKTLVVAALKEGAQEVAAAVIAEAPIKTGELSASVKVSTSTAGTKATAKVSTVYYGRFQNDGTKGRLPEGRQSKNAIVRKIQIANAGGLIAPIKATHFEDKAIAESADDAIQVAMDSLRESVREQFDQ